MRAPVTHSVSHTTYFSLERKGRERKERRNFVGDKSGDDDDDHIWKLSPHTVLLFFFFHVSVSLSTPRESASTHLPLPILSCVLAPSSRTNYPVKQTSMMTSARYQDGLFYCTCTHSYRLRWALDCVLVVLPVVPYYWFVSQ